jgi:hypothetical protein
MALSSLKVVAAAHASCLHDSTGLDRPVDESAWSQPGMLPMSRGVVGTMVVPVENLPGLIKVIRCKSHCCQGLCIPLEGLVLFVHRVSQCRGGAMKTMFGRNFFRSVGPYVL